MISVENLVSMHREDMALLRSEARQAKRDRLGCEREMDQAYKKLRNKLSAEMPTANSCVVRLRAPIAFMVTLMAVFSF
ncbi:hypothetical protein [Maridesulfovibrio sp.]|jgi:hypothetical protein|uniref:hypothetical protein n=1 Tax=Maridesulfovibrio sp. TaxID=2795000 RepID=UPI0029C9E1FA|nr:hypothetical protein [Maridesulfovibrio sp.]